MKEKKAPAGVNGKAGHGINGDRIVSDKRGSRQLEKGFRGTLRIYEGGVELDTDAGEITANGDKRGQRGEVRGFSKAARQRMRRWLVEHRAKSGHDLYGVTLTIPGPPPEKDEVAALWHRFSVAARRAGWGMPWRKEQQARGVPHWHGLLAVPHREDYEVWEARRQGGGVAAPVRDDVDTVEGMRHQLIASEVQEMWRRALDAMPEVVVPAKRLAVCAPETMGRPDRDVEVARSFLVGAHEHMCRVDPCEGQSDPWLRYMLDHCTKRKSHQSDTVGRAWGVINADVFEEVQPSEEVELSGAARQKVVRVLQRLQRPLVPDARCPFGYRHGWRSKRGRLGCSVWFSGQLAAEASRLIAWAQSEASEGPETARHDPDRARRAIERVIAARDRRRRIRRGIV